AACGRGASKSSAITTRPRSRPRTRRPAGRPKGTKRATGFPDRAITTSSPRATRASKRERWVLASWTLTSSMTKMWTKPLAPSRWSSRERHADVGAQRRLLAQRALRVVHGGAEDAARHQRLGVAQAPRVHVALERLRRGVVRCGARRPLGEVRRQHGVAALEQRPAS